MDQFWMQTLWLKLWAVDSNSYVMIIVMATLCAYFVKEALLNPMYAYLCGPLFLFAGLASNALFLDLEWVPTADKSLNMIVATGFGILIAFLALAILARTWILVSDFFTRRPVGNDVPEV